LAAFRINQSILHYNTHFDIGYYIVKLGLFLVNRKTQLKLAIREELSLKYLDQFPIVYIKTNNIEVDGKLYDLCDRRLIYLKKDGRIISLGWEHIVQIGCETCQR